VASAGIQRVPIYPGVREVTFPSATTNSSRRVLASSAGVRWL